VMAVFGAPVAREDDPERAVRAALVIRDAIVDEAELELRIGIATGEALVTLSASPAGMTLPSAFGWPQLSFQESGPITARATFRNTGNALARFDTWFTYSNLGRDFLQTEAPPGIALPGTTSTASSSTKLLLPGQAVIADTTPMFGIIKVHASSSLILLSQRSAETSQDRYVVIAPWRLLLILWFVLVFVVTLRWQLRRRRRS